MSPTTRYRPPERITRDDIEAKLRELRGGVDERVEHTKSTAITVAVGVAVATVVVVYWLGSRRGRRRQMVLEVRRI